MAVFICTFFLNKQNAYILVVCIYMCVWEGGGCVCVCVGGGGGWGVGGVGGLGSCCYVGVYARERDRCMGVRVS